MSPLAYFLLAALTILNVCLFLSRRGGRRDFDQEAYGTWRETSSAFKWDCLISELTGRIFDPGDSDFVSSETSRQLARRFQRERTALALDWLRAVRDEVNQSIRTHRKVARGNSDLKPADEINVWLEFLLFQITCTILYLVIWAYGPARAAKLVRYSLDLAGQLQKVTEPVVPDGRQVAVELVDHKKES